jgi:glycosyltransferase involved in cell wall biosynthesis
MKKVLLVSGSLPPIRCGVGFYTAKLSRQLAEAGLDFELLSTRGVDSDTAAPLRAVPNWKVISLPKIIKAIKRSGAQIIHIQYPAVGYRRQLGINLLPYALRLFKPKLKIVITLHEYHQSRLLGRLRNRITIWPAHRIIVSNQPDLNMLKRHGRKVSIIPIGANFESVKRRPELFKTIMKRNKLDPAGKTLIFFGYAFPAKRLEILLDALAQPALQDYQLLIFPEIDDKSAYHRMLKAKVGELNQSRPRVGINKFLDGPDASAVLQESKYFVLPNSRPLSAKSGTAIAAIENGLILISRAGPKAEDSLPFVHLKNCYLLDDVSPASVAGAIKELDDSAEKAALIQRGGKELAGYFSWSNIVNRHLQIYKEF